MIMPYDVYWLDEEHSIVRIDIHGEVTWEAWYHAIDETVAKINEVPHRVDLIYVDQVGFPKGNPLPHMKASIERLSAQPNLGISVTVSSSRGLMMAVQLVVDVVLRAFNITGRNNGGFVRTVDEAMKRIQVSRRQNGNGASV
jgi:hypothetical protein